MRYVYLGDRMTDHRLVGEQCDPVRRRDGKCVVGGSKQLVVFADGERTIVIRRRLRVLDAGRPEERRL
jgi:hypothetical protein